MVPDSNRSRTAQQAKSSAHGNLGGSATENNRLASMALFFICLLPPFSYQLDIVEEFYNSATTP
jgi:hypothetical protein